MPMVNGKKFGYDKKSKMEAKEYAKKKGMKMSMMDKKMKKSKKK
jgi:hypothetical protein